MKFSVFDCYIVYPYIFINHSGMANIKMTTILC